MTVDLFYDWCSVLTTEGGSSGFSWESAGPSPDLARACPEGDDHGGA